MKNHHKISAAGRAARLARVASCLGTLIVSSYGLANTTETTPQEQPAAKSDCSKSPSPQFVFSWPIDESCDNKPRGGSSKGAQVTLATTPRQSWQDLQQTGISKYEQDRRAILAMQGGYKVNFDFLETVGFSDDYKRDRPYQSWGTEFVYVIENKPNFISLQHLMVMFFKQQDGTHSGPMIMKHWRQDWTYEDQHLLEYTHNNNWVKRRLPRKEAAGQWSQAVFQVDDSPRYESYGQWQHNGSFSTWLSHTTRRPLPRREHSVRDDYDVLEGFNRHTVTQHGWVQEEENWKLALHRTGKAKAGMPYLSKEEGLARYQYLQDFDFSAGDEYMTKTALVWETVRDRWTSIIKTRNTVSLQKSVNGKPMFIPLFALADTAISTPISELEIQDKVNEIIETYLQKD